MGLGALGLTALIVVAMGTYRPEKTTLIQEVKTLGHKMPANYDDKTLRYLPGSRHWDSFRASDKYCA